jgi:hypothetical protein
MTRRKKVGCKRNEKLLLGVFVLLAATLLIGLSGPGISFESLSSGNLLTGAAIGLQSEIEEIVTSEEQIIGTQEDSTLSILGSGLSEGATPILNSSSLGNQTDENLTIYYYEGTGNKTILDWKLNGTSWTVLNMPFEGGSNSTYTKDYSSFDNGGTVDGATWNATGGYDGNGAYEFDSIDNTINLGDPADNSFDFAQGLTFMAWIKPYNNTANAGRIFDKWANGAEDKTLLWYESTQKVQMNLYWTDWTSNSVASSDGTVPDNVWTHIATTYDGSNLKVYINGIENGSTAIIKTIRNSNGNMYISGNSDRSSNQRYFNGTIDEALILDRPLTAEQIFALYENRTDLIVSQQTSVGENWSACVTPNDGTEDGTEVCTSNLTVLADANLVPVISNLIVNSTLGTNYTSENITAYWTATDVDSDAIKSITNWHINDDNIYLANLPFEVDGENNVTDYSDFGNDATIVSAMTYNATGGYDGNGAWDFTGAGSNDYLTLPNESMFDFTSGSFSVGAWIKTDEALGGVVRSIVDKTGGSFTGWYLFADVAGDMWFGFSDGAADNAATYTYTIAQNQWYHVVGTWDGDILRLYVNGTEVGNNNVSTTPAGNNNPVYIGASPLFGSREFNGIIDEVFIVNRSLTPEQISALYQNRTDLIVSQETSVGENWSICVTPNDGTEDGTEVCSDHLTLTEVAGPSLRVVNTTSPACVAGDYYYSTIQSALDATSDGDTVFVCKNTDVGYYGENLTISTGINLYGNQSDVELKVVTDTHGINIISSNVNISNITVSNVTHTSYFGIYSSASSHNVSLSHVTVYNSTRGIQLVGNNNVLNNSLVYGIYSSQGVYASFVENTVVHSSVQGFYLGADSYHNNITSYSNTYGLIKGGSAGGSYTSRVVNNSHLYNNSYDLEFIASAVEYPTLHLENVIFDNPLGNYENYSNVSMDYFISTQLHETAFNWSEAPATLPDGFTYLQGHLKIMNSSSYEFYPIQNLSFNWGDDPLVPEENINLYLYNTSDSSWYLINDTPDTSANTISVSNLSITDPVYLSLLYSSNNDLTECGNLTEAGTTYTLTNNVTSNGTCFTINNNSITLDCDGYAVNYSTTGVIGYGIYAENKNNITLTNCDIDQGPLATGFNHGVYGINLTNSTITSNDISIYNNHCDGVVLTNGSNNNLITLNNITHVDEGGSGVLITTNSNNNNITQNNFTMPSNTSFAIELVNSQETYVYNNTVDIHGTSAYGITTNNADLSTIALNTIYSYGELSMGMGLTNSSNVTIEQNYVNVTEGNSTVIQLYSGCHNNNLISNTFINDLYYGKTVYIVDSNTFNLSNNYIYAFGGDTYSLYVDGSYNGSTIYNNNVTAIEQEASYLDRVDGLVVLNNTFNTSQNLDSGVVVRRSTGINFSGNEIYTTSGPAFSFSGTMEYYNHSIDNTNTINGGTLRYYFNNNSVNLGNEVVGEIYLLWLTNAILNNVTLTEHGLYLFGVNNSTINNSLLNVTESISALYIAESSNNNYISNTTIITTSAMGVFLANGTNNTFIDNTINCTGNNSVPLFLYTGGNYFINNYLNSENSYAIYEWPNAEYNILTYNNSLGDITWNSTNLTTNITLQTNNTIFIQDNLLGLVDDANTMALNASAQLTFYGLGYASTPTLLKNGVNCTDCNISYNNVTGTLYANVSSFSNYTTSFDYPIVELISPAANYMEIEGTTLNITFECNATDITDLENISLYITNSSNGNFSLNQTTIVGGTSNSSNWTLELTVGRFIWNCLATNNNSESNWASVNRTISPQTFSAPGPSPTPSGGSSGGGGGGGALPEAACTLNSDCGDTEIVKNNYCVDNNIYREYITYTCENAGEWNAECKDSSLEKLIEECSFDCEDGYCIEEVVVIEEAKKGDLPLTGGAIALAPSFQNYIWYLASFILFVLLLLVIIKLIQLIRRRRALNGKAVISRQPLPSMVQQTDRPILIKNKRTSIIRPAKEEGTLKDEYHEVNKRLLELEQDSNRPIVKKEVKQKLKIDKYGIKELVLQRRLRKVDARLHGYPVRKPTVIPASAENINLGNELKDVEKELTQVDRKIPRNIKVITRIPVEPKTYERKSLERELNRVTSTLANSSKNPNILLRNLFPKKKTISPKKLAAEENARKEVIRISKKIEKTPLPKNELRDIEEKLAKLQKKLKQN